MSTTVGVITNYPSSALVRQTPGGTGRWEDIQFVNPSTPNQQFDYVVVCNKAARATQVLCSPENIWAILHEPPNETFAHWHHGFPVYARIYTQDTGRKGAKYRLSHPALPWHMDKSYDELSVCPVPPKPKTLSWITSARTDTLGHRQRMRFLARLQDTVTFDLFGRGFQPLNDKWEGLAPYRYSIAVENFQNPYYWTEKIADCFLAYTLPIYHGCQRITSYFPAEAMIRIDINSPDVVEQIRDVLAQDPWEQRLDAIIEARKRVLNRHQLFPYMANEIHEHIRTGIQSSPPRPLVIPSRSLPHHFLEMKLRRTWAALQERIR